MTPTDKVVTIVNQLKGMHFEAVEEIQKLWWLF
jgi:hypothetical protein